MAGLIVVLGFFTFPSALPEFTVSPANRVTARPTSALVAIKSSTPDAPFKKSREELGLRSGFKPHSYSISGVTGVITCKTSRLPI